MDDQFKALTGSLYASMSALLCARKGHGLPLDTACWGCISDVGHLREAIMASMFSAADTGLQQGLEGDIDQAMDKALADAERVVHGMYLESLETRAAQEGLDG